MTASTQPPVFPRDIRRIWLGEQTGTFLTRMFRRSINIDQPVGAAQVSLFAEGRYQLWVNGVWVGRGPHFHHPNRLPIATYDLTPHLRSGENVIAVLVGHTDNAYHNHTPTGRPGLAAVVELTDHAGNTQSIQTDASWRATAKTGWRSSTPRRSWAIDHLEVFDAADAPDGWQSPGFDDSTWSPADVLDSPLPTPDSEFLSPRLPLLRSEFIPAKTLLGVHETTAPPVEITPDFKHGTYAEQLMAAPRAEPTTIKCEGSLNGEGGGLRIAGLSPEAGAIVDLGLGAEYVGHVVLEFEAASAGVVDVGWSEHCRLGYPTVLQKGTSYVDQVHVAPGRTRWMPLQFNAGGYVVLFLRGFTGSVTISRCGMLATEPDLDWRGHFECSDPTLNKIWELCKWSQRVGTQEGLMDCPTREQATYIGDGHPVAKWIALITGDTRFWTYLTEEQFARPSREGLVRSTPFSGRNDTLLDYTLLAIIWTLEHANFVGDTALAQQYLPVCRSINRYFDERTNDAGLFNWEWKRSGYHAQWEEPFDPALPNFEEKLNLFIDHPGMGWHNPHDPGIDRQGVNAAINALRVRAKNALAAIERTLGNDAEAQAHAEAATTLASTVASTFYDEKAQAIADGMVDGKLIDCISQHTNVWAIWAESTGLDEAEQRDLLRRMLADAQAGKIARGGPYFWIYIYPVAARLGLEAEVLELTRKNWGTMLEDGSTTLWETWAGDDHDSRCHPWSGAPLEFLLGSILGLPTDPADTYVLRPRYDLLPAASGRACLPVGDFTIVWETEGDTVRLRGTLPAGVSAQLASPDSSDATPLSGDWEHSVKTSAAPA